MPFYISARDDDDNGRNRGIQTGTDLKSVKYADGVTPDDEPTEYKTATDAMLAMAAIAAEDGLAFVLWAIEQELWIEDADGLRV